MFESILKTNQNEDLTAMKIQTLSEKSQELRLEIEAAVDKKITKGIVNQEDRESAISDYYRLSPASRENLIRALRRATTGSAY